LYREINKKRSVRGRGFVVKPILVGGKFHVTCEVLEGSTVISQIDSTTIAPRNRVTIKNVSALPKAVEVEVSLPNASARLQFDVNGLRQSGWTDRTSVVIASMGTTTLECDIVHTGGTPNTHEPIQFDKLSSKPALGTTFYPESDPKVPFQITIQVS
jgi:hypothetical protein